LLADRLKDEKCWQWYDKIWNYAWKYFVDRLLTLTNHRYSDEKSLAGKTDYHTMGACYEVLNVIIQE